MIYDSFSYEYPESERIIVIGDIHGDIKRFKRILIDANIINDNLEWIAQPPNTIVVQVGDQIDSAIRVPGTVEWEVLDDTNMIYFTDSLDNIARTKGGKVISLIGNHELMNVLGNFSYVSQHSLLSDRHKYFMPKGTLSPILAKRPIVVKIGALFFCHAGVKKSHLDIMGKYNKDISYLNDIWKRFILSGEIYQDDVEIFEKVLADGEDGILWTRALDNEEENDYVMKKLGLIYMFIGHTPVNSIKLLNSKIWYTDTGISRSFATTSYQYIDINKHLIQIRTVTE